MFGTGGNSCSRASPLNCGENRMPWQWGRKQTWMFLRRRVQRLKLATHTVAVFLLPRRTQFPPLHLPYCTLRCIDSHASLDIRLMVHQVDQVSLRYSAAPVGTSCRLIKIASTSTIAPIIRVVPMASASTAAQLDAKILMVLPSCKGRPSWADGSSSQRMTMRAGVTKITKQHWVLLGSLLARRMIAQDILNAESAALAKTCRCLSKALLVNSRVLVTRATNSVQVEVPMVETLVP
mmetsp:Transcript_63322/g.167806  ORF Transcript_63322/g.167806 Transcript_63322/m.167806 type:complete len:236 (+) Transcript_63322:656-1363(+)